jgi:dTDP-4-dehydrorhamnose 3,5-epimerase
MIRRDSPLFSGFGEIYFSLVEPGAVKAWKRHRRQTQLFAVPHGLVEVVVHDAREDSPSRGRTASFLLGRKGHYKLLRIPPGLWYGFACRGAETAVLANCADLPHDPGEAERLPPDSGRIPWRLAGGLLAQDAPAPEQRP